MQSSKEYFRVLMTIHGAMLFGQIALLVVVYFIIAPARAPEHDVAFNIAGAAVLVIGFALSYLVPNKIIREAKTKRGLREKLQLYRKALIIILAILEGIGLFLTICYMITGELIFVFAAIFTMVVFFLKRPTLGRVTYKLDLDESERRILENSNSAI